jgi:hypothetical protein
MPRDTSKKAYKEEVVGTLSRRHAQVLTALEFLKEATNSELAIHLDWSINRVTPRVLELRTAGKVFDTGKRKCKVTGRLAHTWSAGPRQESIALKKYNPNKPIYTGI